MNQIDPHRCKGCGALIKTQLCLACSTRLQMKRQYATNLSLRRHDSGTESSNARPDARGLTRTVSESTDDDENRKSQEFQILQPNARHSRNVDANRISADRETLRRCVVELQQKLSAAFNEFVKREGKTK